MRRSLLLLSLSVWFLPSVMAQQAASPDALVQLSLVVSEVPSDEVPKLLSGLLAEAAKTGVWDANLVE